MRRSRCRSWRAIPTATALTYSATGLPTGLTIAPDDGRDQRHARYASAGTHPVTVTVTDRA